jgi:hypothetical protein
MSYVASLERIAKGNSIREGIETGRLAEQREVLIRLLSIKFGVSEEEKNLVRNCNNSNRNSMIRHT